MNGKNRFTFHGVEFTFLRVLVLIFSAVLIGTGIRIITADSYHVIIQVLCYTSIPVLTFLLGIDIRRRRRKRKFMEMG